MDPSMIISLVVIALYLTAIIVVGNRTLPRVERRGRSNSSAGGGGFGGAIGGGPGGFGGGGGGCAGGGCAGGAGC